MPFRQKLRKTFSRGSSSGSETLGDDISCNPKFSMYKPGEKIPYKYRRPVDRAHKEKLEAFSFDNAWKRCSHQSQYSPMGSRMPSRKNSVEQFHGRRSIHTRNGELAGGDYGDMSPSNAASLSRRNSTDTPDTMSDNSGSLSTSLGSTYTFSRNDTPFTQEDITLALQRSRFQVPS